MSGGGLVDFSDSSNTSCTTSVGSPYSSPLQRVPYMPITTGAICDDNNMIGPHLCIIEQPQTHFRFRYKSERENSTHGFLLGSSSKPNLLKNYPTVELVNYTDKAVIRCKLYQEDEKQEHPHRLEHANDHDEDNDLNMIVPEDGSYKVCFSGIEIIHTAKKKVSSLILKKLKETSMNNQTERALRLESDKRAKEINLNIVKLRFSAHDVNTDEEICRPVYSDAIHNSKSAATNVLRICDYSRCYGRPRGGDDVFLLVEKVLKRNITVNMVELDDDGNTIWTAPVTLMDANVHHQYAIKFKTPPYKNHEITHEAKVFIELARPSDGRRSNRVEFTYIAETHHKIKRKKLNSNQSSPEYSFGPISPMHIPNGVPVKTINVISDEFVAQIASEKHTVQPQNFLIHARQTQLSNNLGSQTQNNDHTIFGARGEIKQSSPVPQSPSVSESTSEAESIMYYKNEPMLWETLSTCEEFNIIKNGSEFDQAELNQVNPLMNNNNPLLSQTNAPQCLPAELFENDTDMKKFNAFAAEYMKFDIGDNEVKFKPDSGVPKGMVVNSNPPTSFMKSARQGSSSSGASEYSAYYEAEDGIEVKKLIKEICEIVKTSGGSKRQIIKSKLERLLELRMSNGDTFLHMTLVSNQASFEYMVKLIHSMKMCHLLNLTNDQQMGILHLAILHDMPQIVSFLVSKGCDPMLRNLEGNNAVHQAVICQTCLEPLLDAIKSNRITSDLNSPNFEKQAPLHLAAIFKSESCARALLKHGASCLARDLQGRTPLHVATADGCLPIVQCLLEHVAQDDIDAVDGRGYTALQTVAGGEANEDSLEILKLLLDKKADPWKHENCNDPAYKLAKRDPRMWRALRELLKPTEESEEEYETADEDEPVVLTSQLQGMKITTKE